jgi:RHS repeat-associated protein
MNMTATKMSGVLRTRMLLNLVLLLAPVFAGSQTLTGTRSSAFEYSPGTGLASAEIIEPDSARADYCIRTGYTRDAFGNQTAVTVSACSGASAQAQFVTRTTTTVYAAQSVALPSGGTVAVPAGAFPTLVTNALSQSESRLYDPRYGTLISVTGPNGLTTQVQYDELGRKVLEIAPDGNRTITRYCLLPAAVANVSSNSAGCISAPAAAPSLAVSYVEVQPSASTGTPNGPYTRKYSDALGRVIREETQGFDGASQPATARTVVKDAIYNSHGAVAKVSQPFFLESGSSVTTGGAAGWTTTVYDALGRPTTAYTRDDEGSTSVGGQTVSEASFNYNGLSVSEVTKRTYKNAQGQQQELQGGLPTALMTTRLKNPIGQLIEVKDQTSATVTYKYDAFGNLTETRDPHANRTTVSYDIRGRKTSMSDPNAGTWNYRYNALGEMTGQQSPLQIAGTSSITAGNWTTLAYDVLGRVIQRADPEYTTTWSYDKYANGSTCPRGVGKLCEVTTSHGVSKRTAYDTYGRAASLTQTVSSGPTFTTSRTFDSNGRLSTYTYPTGLTLAFAYTATGHQWRITKAGAMMWQLDKVSAWGKPEQFQLGGSAQTTVHAFNPQTGRIASIQAGPGGSILSQVYGWDTVGNLTDRVETYNPSGPQSISENFAYDEVNRLKSYQVASPGIAGLSRNVVLVYGATGNILYKSDVGTYNYPAAGAASTRPAAVSSIAAASGANPSYTYDMAGNMIGATNGKYTQIGYTSFNLPDGSSGVLGTNGTRYTWQYGPDHERVKEVKVSGGTTRTTWYHHPDNENGLGFEQEQAGSAIANRHYVSAVGQAFLMLTTGGVHTEAAAQTVTAQQWWHRDQLGSVATVTDATYSIVQRMSYDPFGKRRTIAGSYDAAGTLSYDHPGTTDRGFTGHEHLDDVGIVHMNGRLYNPLIGRFMQADPLIMDPSWIQNLNRYSYVANNPLNAVDPSGRFGVFEVLAIIAVARATGIINTKTARQLAGLVFAVWIGGLDPSLFGANACTVGNISGISVVQAVVGGMAAGAVACGTDCAMSGGASGLLFAGAGLWANNQYGFDQAGQQHLGRAVAHGVAGCLVGEMEGGKCGQGAATAFIGKSLMSRFEKTGSLSLDVARAAVMGGTLAEIGGGKFANGARMGAFQYLFNECAHGGCGWDDTKVIITGNYAAGAVGEYGTYPASLHLEIRIQNSYDVITIEGQPGDYSMMGGLRLVSGSDNPHPSPAFSMELAVPKGMTMQQLATDLVAAAKSYQNNLPYNFPLAGVGKMMWGYNSNSYVSGVLMQATGQYQAGVAEAARKARFLVPGFDKPIPLKR